MNGLREITLLPDDPSTSGVPAWCSFPVNLDDQEIPCTLLSRIECVNKGHTMTIRGKLPQTGFTLLTDEATLVMIHLKDYEHVRWGKKTFSGGLLDGTEEAFTYPAKGSPAFHEWVASGRADRTWAKNREELYYIYEAKRVTIFTNDPLVLEFTLAMETPNPPDWVAGEDAHGCVLHGYH